LSRSHVRGYPPEPVVEGKCIEAHWRFFSRTLPNLGRELPTDMPLVCERFRVIYR
jgi:hypothetical protein